MSQRVDFECLNITLRNQEEQSEVEDDTTGLEVVPPASGGFSRYCFKRRDHCFSSFPFAPLETWPQQSSGKTSCQ
jgi:hypothetical protein